MAIKTIPFKKEDVKKYIDGEIDFWREELLKHVSVRHQNLQMPQVRATIATYQLMRMRLFGRKKPIK